MAWGSGTFTRVGGTTHWLDDKNAAINIVATRHDTNDEDIATGINQCLNKDGSNAATGNLNLGTHKLSSVADATLRSDAPNVGNIQDGLGVNMVAVGGTANAITLTPSPAITAYVSGQIFRFLPAFPNTTAATIAVSGLAAKSVVKLANQVLIRGDIQANPVEVLYDGTNFQLITVPYYEDNFTLTITGTTVGNTATARYIRTGRQVTLYIPNLTGTSNTTACTFTGIPAELQPTRSFQFGTGNSLFTDNGAVVSTVSGEILGGTGTIVWLLANNAAGFTNANAKGLSAVGGIYVTYSLI